MAIKDPVKRPTYRLTDEFKFEDMFAALNNFGIVSESEIDKWRADEEKRQSAYTADKSKHWWSRFSKS
jgi:hypothetical protein